MRWRLDIAHLVLHLICRHLVENEEKSPDNFVGRVADCKDNTVVRLSGCRILPSESLEVGPIMRKQRFALANGIG